MVVQYLVDAFPNLSGHVLPAAKDPKSAYDRYMINLLTDVWFNKVNSFWFKALLVAGTDEATGKADELFDAIKTQFEPKLVDALGKTGSGPFIGGAERMTLFEVGYFRACLQQRSCQAWAEADSDRSSLHHSSSGSTTSRIRTTKCILAPWPLSWTRCRRMGNGPRPLWHKKVLHTFGTRRR